MMEVVRRSWKPVLQPVLHFYWRFSRGMTLGVRGLVLNPAGEVMLVKHGYLHGWHLPGGGVETGETVREALARELSEEAGIRPTGAAPLFALYLNSAASRRDHVAMFVVREFRQEAPPKANREIVAHGFFAPAALPPDTAASTRRRLAEVLDGEPVAERW